MISLPSLIQRSSSGIHLVFESVALCLQIAHAVTGFDRVAALQQDRAIVEFGGHQVNTDTVLGFGVVEGALVGIEPFVCGQQGRDEC